VIENACDENSLLASLAHAVDLARSNRAVAPTSEELRVRWSTLTPREQEVCVQVVQGQSNRQIAADLGTREKTIRVHRARVMTKMGVRSLQELVRSVDGLVADDLSAPGAHFASGVGNR
jgi:FixJ family two-component response regulator